MATPKNGLTEQALYLATFATGIPHNTPADSDPLYPLSLMSDRRASMEEALLLKTQGFREI